MIIPIGDENVKGGFYPIFSYTFLVVNVLIFLYSLFSGLPEFIQLYGADPCAIKLGKNWWSIFSSMFMHGGLLHLLGNMLFMWIFADNIESTIGNVQFLFFYLIGGLVSVLMHVYIASTDACITLVGASGAISAVMGAYLVMFPKSRIKMLFIIKVFYLPAFIFLGFWIAQQVYMVYNAPQESNVAFWAHIGGFIFGVFAGLFFRNKYPKIEEIKDEYHTVLEQPKRYNNRF